MKQENPKRIPRYGMAIFMVIVCILLDQWTKHIAITHLKNQEPIVLIKGVFELFYLENKGAAFGLFQNKKLFFVISALLILFLIVWFYSRVPLNRHFLPLRVCAVMLAGGAIGNVIDRLYLGYVVDFFYFKLIDFPVFNVADIFVTVSMFLLIFLILFFYKEDDLDKILHN